MKDADLIQRWNTLVRLASDNGFKALCGDEYILLQVNKHTVQTFETVSDCNAFLHGFRRSAEIRKWSAGGAK